ncbi:hypothetical protein JG687_00012264 [Phytophthora cactorum]|uniref:Uncharacterized protein n=1 Tax=Phytophthora cactorum TaxID=29920 RepID=A0A8T1U4B7_9STRA|nr:hypothetical protein GQ600_26866 [Phytophthora cactorum]KAG6953667.1 hypothetical protein JG687_00012264 [Phytophthora cactorum]
MPSPTRAPLHRQPDRPHAAATCIEETTIVRLLARAAFQPACDPSSHVTRWCGTLPALLRWQHVLRWHQGPVHGRSETYLARRASCHTGELRHQEVRSASAVQPPDAAKVLLVRQCFGAQHSEVI